MHKSKTSTYMQLFLTMLKIGAFTFGGGYAMISLLENEFLVKKQWITKEEFMDMIAIAESTPGPVAVNSATYIGYKIGGAAGSLSATLGVVIPSFSIIYIISMFFERFISFKYVSLAFRGIQVCVIYLILSAGLSLLKQLEKTVLHILILLSVLTVMLISSVLSMHISSILCIFISGILGIATYTVCLLKRKGGGSIDNLS